MFTTGSFPDIEELFPARPLPVKQGTDENHVSGASASKQPGSSSGPVATGAGFFTPDAPNTFRGWRPDPAPPQPFRMGLPRDSL